MNKILIKCFKRIQINKTRSNKELEKLFEKKEEVKSKLAVEQDASKIENLQVELEKVSEDIADMC